MPKLWPLSRRGTAVSVLTPLCRYYHSVQLTHFSTGKPYAHALSDEVGDAISVMRYYAGFADKLHGQGMHQV